MRLPDGYMMQWHHHAWPISFDDVCFAQRISYHDKLTVIIIVVSYSNVHVSDAALQLGFRTKKTSFLFVYEVWFWIVVICFLIELHIISCRQHNGKPHQSKRVTVSSVAGTVVVVRLNACRRFDRNNQTGSWVSTHDMNLFDNNLNITLSKKHFQT